MKKLLCLLLCLCLALPCALAEEGASGVLAELPEGNYNLLGVAGDALYVASWNNTYRAVDGGWVSVELPMQESVLFFQEDGLYAMVQDRGVWNEDMQDYIPPEEGVYSLRRAAVKEDGGFDEPETLCPIDWGFRDDDSPEIRGLAVADDTAYLLAHTWESDDSQLWRIDLATGKGTLVTSDYLYGLLPCGNGLFLSQYENESEAGPEDGTISSPQIVTVHPETGEVTVLGSMVNDQCGCLVYDAASGAAYYCDLSYVYRFDPASGASERVGRMTSQSYRGSCAAAVWHDRYYLADNQRQFVDEATLDPALLPSRTLRLSSFDLDEQNRGFLKEYPDVAIEESSRNVSSAQELTQHMASDDAADIYFLNLNRGAFKTLRDKGWVADLSSSQKLMDTIAAMDAHLVRPLTADGKLYGVPIDVSALTTGYYPQALETFGLTADELPRTYEDLLESIVTWQDNYADEYPDAIFFSMMDNLFETLFRQIFEAQVTLCEARGERMTFNTPTIQKLLKRLESDEVKRAIEDVCPIVEGGLSWGSDEADHTLFTTGYYPLPVTEKYDEGEQPLLMRLDSETEPVIPLYMTVMVVNPKSEHLDTAMAYLEYVADHLPQTVRIALMPDVNEPIESYFYQGAVSSTSERIDQLETRLEALRAAGKELDDDPESPYYNMTMADLESDLSYSQGELEWVEQNRWAFSPEEVAYYHEYVEPYLVTITDALFQGENNQASTIMQQFIDGSMDAEHFIREFDRIVDMMQMEQGV